METITQYCCGDIQMDLIITLIGIILRITVRTIYGIVLKISRIFSIVRDTIVGLLGDFLAFWWKIIACIRGFLGFWENIIAYIKRKR